MKVVWCLKACFPYVQAVHWNHALPEWLVKWTHAPLTYDPYDLRDVESSTHGVVEILVFIFS